jgi:hypothetical protein
MATVRSRERGVPVMLDGAHVLGQQRVDLRRLEAAGVDYWISDAHKWLFSPKGSAVLWVTREKQHRLMPSALGAVVRSAASMVRPPLATQYPPPHPCTITRQPALASACPNRCTPQPCFHRFSGFRHYQLTTLPATRGVGGGRALVYDCFSS